MHNFISFIKEFRLPKKDELKNAVDSFSRNEMFLFVLSIGVALIATLVMLERINKLFIIDIPVNGGIITEGIIGTPSLVNPVLAISDADKDLSSLIYSGLMRKSGDTFIGDLADSYTERDDGLVYTFHIRNTATFQDGHKVTPEDVIFTINKIQDRLIKSPKKSSWDGVTVSKKDDSTVVFTLNKPYISFMNNTTIGILPEHLWKKVSVPEFGLSALNIKAIGTGPYKIDSISKNNDDIPTEYSLSSFSNFAQGQPHVKYIHIISYANEHDLIGALTSHTIDQAGGISPENAQTLIHSSYNIQTSTLPRAFGIFYNSTNNKIFEDPHVIHAIDLALDRQAIVNEVLDGYGTTIHNPIPSTILTSTPANDTIRSVDDANKILDTSGWTIGDDGVRSKGDTTTQSIKKKVGKKIVTQTIAVRTNKPAQRLSFSLITGDTPELKTASLVIKKQLAEIGVEVEINKVYETGALNQKIRSRDYEALFFGQIVNNESDLYAFWHSSQKVDPGLNIAMYSNKSVDALLESIQKTFSYKDRVEKYKAFINIFEKDTPALLIYSPKYIYAISKQLDFVNIGSISIPSERFLSVSTWYASKESVWKIFKK